MARKRSFLSQMSRSFYLASRLTGDAQAIKRGRYVKRRARRAERRAIWRLLRKSGL